MAKASRAASASSENKTPLVIALVFFVLSTIAVGVLAYMFNGDLTGAKEAEKTAKAAKDAADQAAVKAKEETLLYKAALGILTEKDKEQLAGVRFKPDLYKAHGELMTALKNRTDAVIADGAKAFVGGGAPFSATSDSVFKWDWANAADVPPPPAKSIIDGAVAALAQKELTDRTAKIDAARIKQTEQTYVAKTNEADDTTKKAKDEIASIPGKVAAETDKTRQAFEAFKTDYVKDSGVQRGAVQKLAEEKADRDTEIKKRDERIKAQEVAITRLLDKQEDFVDPFQFDKPQGRILRRYSESLVDIDLGTSDKLRPGITFSIFPFDTPTRGMQPRMRTFREADGKLVTKPVPKGKLEVVSVNDANIAQCRITEEDSQVRDRILAGDLIYNAIWRKGMSEHVALFGIFDLDGDGKDDMAALIAGLRKVGVTVDAYFDLATQKWVGEITSQTTFGVEGWYPTVAAADGNKEGKIRILAGISKARTEVKEKGIRILRPRDFFPRIGYNAKLEVSEDAINQAATGFIRAILTDSTDKPADAGK